MSSENKSVCGFGSGREDRAMPWSLGDTDTRGGLIEVGSVVTGVGCHGVSRQPRVVKSDCRQ